MANQRRGPWSTEEDQTLMGLVHTQGALNWVKIAGLLDSRTPKQCRERYHQNLKPSLNHDPISPEEGLLIEKLVVELGKRWAEIARRLHNRSDNAVKNWWNGSMNRRRRMHRRRGPGYDEAMVHSVHSPYHRPEPLQLPVTIPQYTIYPSTLSPTATGRFPQYWGTHSGLPSPSSTSPGGDSFWEGESGSHYTTSPTSAGHPGSPVELAPLKRRPEVCSPPVAFEYRPCPKVAATYGLDMRLPPIRATLEAPPQLPTAPNSPIVSGSLSGQSEASSKDSRMKVGNLLS
ncbi:myb-like DNA-binding domain-containing protein [Apiospora kogelbergensis]|uniref:Myb-like DNA-binding domain-containing protein n=1 Tax=Apiospora kogelbergensis TaxID=1337665 RepID=A0AAW0QD43_9PEZI